MAVPTYFKFSKEDVERRKELKEKLDKIVNLSNDNTHRPMENLSVSMQNKEKIRLLNEGAVFDSWEELRMYFCKGTIRKFVNDLEDDYVGYINLGHMSLDAVPLVMGTWTKEDLEVVELEDGRCALDCTPHFNTELGFVKDILSQDIPLSVSVELLGELDYDNTRLLEAPVYRTLYISGFSIVGSPANTDSWDIGEKMKANELIEKLQKLMADAGNTPDEPKPEDPEDKPESKEEETPEDPKPAEPNADPEPEGKTEDPGEEDLSAENIAQILNNFEAVVKENTELRKKVEEKAAEEEKLNNQAKKLLGMFEEKLNASPAAPKGKDPIWGC